MIILMSLSDIVMPGLRAAQRFLEAAVMKSFITQKVLYVVFIFIFFTYFYFSDLPAPDEVGRVYLHTAVYFWIVLMIAFAVMLL